MGVGGASCTLAPRPVWQESSPGQDWTPRTAAAATAQCAEVSCWVNKHDDVALRTGPFLDKEGLSVERNGREGQAGQGGAGIGRSDYRRRLSDVGQTC